MKRFTFTVGIGVDRDGEPVDQNALAQAVAAMRMKLASRFGGFTEAPVIGGHVNDAGDLVMEHSIRWLSVGEDNTEDAAGLIAKWIGRLLNQESVLLEVESIQSQLVTTDTPVDVFNRMSEQAHDRVLH